MWQWTWVTSELRPGVTPFNSIISNIVSHTVTLDYMPNWVQFFFTFVELNVASIVPWIVIPIVVLAICVTMFVTWRRRTAGGLDRRGSSFRTSIINRMRTQSTNSQTKPDYWKKIKQKKHCSWYTELYRFWITLARNLGRYQGRRCHKHLRNKPVSRRS